MSETDINSSVKRRYNDLSLDLNLDQATADEAWNNYENIQLKYTLEGEQLPWLACALYAACRRRSVPTVGGRPGNMIQGNCVSLTRMLQHCNLPLTEFIKKMKAWLAMSHFDEGFCRRVDLLERNFAVSNNIFKKYKPIFLDLFKDPANDLPRPPRSRKQRRPPCNPTELFHFCWTLYILIKGKYPSIPQDLVSCYSLLLASIDLIYSNVVLSSRKDLINPDCEGLPKDLLNNESSSELSSWPVPIMDYLCEKFEGVLVETKVVREYYWNKHIRDLIEKKVLKGGVEGTGLLEQSNFDHNVKEVKNAYEEYLLSYGEFDERMFLNEDEVVKGVTSPPSTHASHHDSPVESGTMRQARRNLVQSFEGDHHLVPQTPITGRRYTIDRPTIGTNPLTVVTSGLQKLYALLAGRKNNASEELLEMFKTCKTNPEEKITSLVTEMSDEFCRLYTQATEDYNGPSIDFAKMRLQMGQMLYYTFLEHILMDERRRGVDLMAILKEDLFHRTLFTCCLEIVLKSYNDPRRFPWSLQVGHVEPYYFIRIIEPVIRSEKQSDNQLSRELVKHLKGIEEQILDSLAWKAESSLWQNIQSGNLDIPSCQDVNFSDQLETEMNPLTPSISLSSTPVSPASKLVSDKATPSNLQLSPLSTISERFQSPLGQSSARRTLFPSSTSTGSINPSPTLTVSRPVGLGNRSPVVSSVLTTSSSPSIHKSPSRITVQVKENGVTTLYSVPTNPQGTTETPETGGDSGEKVADTPNTDKKKDKPKRHGSLALFCRKFYTLANMRLRELCDRLDITDKDLRKKIWTCFEHSIIHHTELMRDRHMDQMVMCAIYITCKVTGNDRIFQEIMKHYRNQPQAASHVYRSVLISRSNTSQGLLKSEANIGQQQGNAPPPTPSHMTGTSASFDSEERGDLILFYNQVYVQQMKAFALKFRSVQEGDLPPLSPLPVIRHTPVSPRRRISSNHSVFINSLSPDKGSTAMSPRKPLPYFFNRSPAKDLRVINTMLKMKGVGGVKRLLGDTELSGLDVKRPLLVGMTKRLQGVQDDRLSATPTLDLPQDSTPTQDASTMPQNGHATEQVGEDYGTSEQP